MWDDVSANKSLNGNERETPSTRSQLMAHAWLLNVAIWVVRLKGKRIPCIPGGFCLHGAGLAGGVASRLGAPLEGHPSEPLPRFPGDITRRIHLVSLVHRATAAARNHGNVTSWRAGDAGRSGSPALPGDRSGVG
jgi:hypothetical protein